MEFSGIVKITDLNDFLNPSENCSVHSSMIKKSSENTAKVSLSDCLACSGCVTSAESVLLEQHSIDKLIEKLRQEEVCVSISQQSLAAIAQGFSLELSDCLGMIRTALASVGVNRVEMMCESRDIVLEECYKEFMDRFRQGSLPVICSECPGLVSYTEKKADNCIFPMLSNVKTPMIVQREILQIQGFHATVMPCYDKKLEAVRDTSVDLVLTTKEMMDYLNSLGFVDCKPTPGKEFYSSTRQKTGSLGYGEYIFLRAVKELYGESAEFEVKTTRRRDVIEIVSGELKFCLASGFQNIQNMMRMIKQRKIDYAFIEMMACPTGCLNGGGQPRMTRETIHELEERIGSLYREVQAEETEVPLYRQHQKVTNTNSLSW